MWKHFMKISKIIFTGINTNLNRKKYIWRKAESKSGAYKNKMRSIKVITVIMGFQNYSFHLTFITDKKNTIFLLEVTVLTEFTFREYIWKIHI